MARAVLTVVAVTVLACGAATAQTPDASADFPQGAAPLEPAALRQRLTGKVFRVVPKSAAPWRLQFNDNGYYFVNTESGYSDSGKWRIEASSLCTEPQKTKAACNEMRQAAETLYLKRDSGEIVKFEPR